MIGYMRDEEIFFTLLGIVTGAALVGGLILAVYKSRARKLKVLEDALQSPNVDADTKRVLVSELTKGPLARLFAGGKLLVVLGWIGVFIGVSIWASGGGPSAEEVGIPFSLISFGILTIPFALRELDHKRPAATRRP